MAGQWVYSIRNPQGALLPSTASKTLWSGIRQIRRRTTLPLVDWFSQKVCFAISTSVWPHLKLFQRCTLHCYRNDQRSEDSSHTCPLFSLCDSSTTCPWFSLHDSSYIFPFFSLCDNSVPALSSFCMAAVILALGSVCMTAIIFALSSLCITEVYLVSLLYVEQ